MFSLSSSSSSLSIEFLLVDEAVVFQVIELRDVVVVLLIRELAGGFDDGFPLVVLCAVRGVQAAAFSLWRGG